MDRAAAVRSALRTLVARHGFHGASMSAVASQAGVATGLSPDVRLAADETELTDEQLNEIARACWRAISKPT
jgi:Bacterial regulatory proteins, tetR family